MAKEVMQVQKLIVKTTMEMEDIIFEIFYKLNFK
jgi:hypothetical protein